MTRGTVRRAQLVAPFGVGAITVVPDGTALLTAGLDYWYRASDGSSAAVDMDEYIVEEWRLQEVLRVNHFRLPPDYRTARYASADQKNLRLTIPALRFPRWNFCPMCRSLEQLPLSFGELRRCGHCEEQIRATSRRRKAPVIAQVPFVAMCEAGHLQDFPIREWVHRSETSPCEMRMTLRATGAASLGAQLIECKCGARRTLARITEATTTGGQQRTFLSSNLTGSDDEYLCRGSTPWHGDDQGRGCGRHLRGSLRAASNLYFALVRSSIYLPRESGDVPEELLEMLVNPPFSTILNAVPDASPQQLRSSRYGNLLTPFEDDDTVQRALDTVSSSTDPQAATTGRVDGGEWSLQDEEAFRAQEFTVLREHTDTQELKIRRADLGSYDQLIASSFARITLIDKLRETRALWGFNRIYPDGGRLRDRRSMLWRSEPDWAQSWLPAYIVRGEGVYLELDPDRLAQWERQPAIRARVSALHERFNDVREARQLRDRPISPRFVLVHTLAHLLINRFTYECGYSSASLRERLYISNGPTPMAGLLIYTAAGDSEGTMGGLVRMGKTGNLDPV